MSERPSPGPARPSAPARRLARIALLAWLAGGIAGCAAPRDKDAAATGSLAEAAPPSAVELARDEAGRTMRLGLARYRLSVGDTVEVSFLIDSRAVQPAYRLAPNDEFDVDFRTHPEYNRPVIVRPDGRISLPGKNGIRVAGLTPEGAAERIRRTYDDVLVEPVVTVMLRKFRTPADDFREMTQRADLGRVKVLAIEPDGRINLPLVPPVQAAGRSVAEVQALLDAAYRRRVASISTSVRLASLTPGNTMVFGEVRSPGPVTLSGPRTLAQLIGAAGGLLPTAAGGEVRIIAFDEAGRSVVQVVDLGAPGLADATVVAPNATVYVPPSLLARTARTVDLVARQILMFNGTGFGVNYITGPGAGGGGARSGL